MVLMRKGTMGPKAEKTAAVAAKGSASGGGAAARMQLGFVRVMRGLAKLHGAEVEVMGATDAAVWVRVVGPVGTCMVPASASGLSDLMDRMGWDHGGGTRPAA